MGGYLFEIATGERCGLGASAVFGTSFTQVGLANERYIPFAQGSKD
jgi:hypothetical protein